jgi:Zn finger protein HypA/HybF involved in hydrogenase expression
VNDNFPKLFWLNDSSVSCGLTIFLVALLLGSVGLGWVVNGFLILLALAIFVPAIAFWGFRWWLKSNLVEDQCPACSYEFTGFNRTECRCPNCGEPLKVEAGRFQRLTPPGTIDVEAIEVSVQQLED